MTKVQHVKIPVTDLARSVAWYSRLLDLVPFREFVEQGALRGAALRSPEAGFAVALRERQFCASQPDLAGFDLVALHMANREALADLAAKCDQLGIEHGPIQDRGPNEAVVDVNRPEFRAYFLTWKDGTFMPVRYDQDTKAKAIRLVREHAGDYPSEYAAITAVAGRLGMSAETLRKWIRQAAVDEGQAPGVSSEAEKQIRELKRKVNELERTIEILTAATSFFAREHDPLRR